MYLLYQNTEIKYIFQEYYLNEGDSNILTITKSSLKSKLFLNGELSILSIRLKGINLHEGFSINKYNIGYSKEGDFKLLNVEISKKGISYKKEGKKDIGIYLMEWKVLHPNFKKKYQH